MKILPNSSVEWANLVDQNEIIDKFESGELESDKFGETLSTHIYLSELYLLDGRFQDCFKVQLLNKSELCFETIQRYNLDSNIVLENLDSLQIVSTKKTCRLLLNRADLIQPALVLEFTKNEEFLHEYLSSVSYHQINSNAALRKKIELCAKFSPAGLFSLLRELKSKLQSDEPFLVSVSNCLKLQDCVGESVWLLGLQGNVNEALELLVSDKRDIHAAVVFAKEWNVFDLRKVFQTKIDFVICV